jgi:hypothetical protein
MNKTELKELVKKYFSLTEKTEDKVEFATAKLADGTEVTNKKDSELAVGDELYVITAEGEEVLAPSGEHTTDSGITVTVDEQGKITGIHHPDQEGEGSLEANEDVSLSQTTLAEQEDIKEMIIEAIMEEVAPKMEEMRKEMSNCMERLAQYEEKMKEYMSSTPAEKPSSEKKFSKIKSTKAVYNTKRYEAALNKFKK